MGHMLAASREERVIVDPSEATTVAPLQTPWFIWLPPARTSSGSTVEPSLSRDQAPLGLRDWGDGVCVLVSGSLADMLVLTINDKHDTQRCDSRCTNKSTLADHHIITSTSAFLFMKHMRKL